MSGASDLANSLSTSLLTGTDFTVNLPDFSSDDFKVPSAEELGLTDTIPELTLSDLTTGSIDGTGAFDKLMVAYKAHLKSEYEANRITGEQYTKAYIALTESAMNGGVQFVLGKDAARWQAINAQIAARIAQVNLVTARVELESAKTRLQVLGIEALSAQIGYALNKIRLATESVNYDRAKYELDNLLPQQKTIGDKNILRLSAEIIGVEKDNELKGKQVQIAQGEVDMIPDKIQLLKKQVMYQTAQTEYVGKQTLQAQKEIDLYPEKEAMLKEQVEAGRAQTLNTRRDGTTVVGQIGKQMALYDQQITSYRRDAENKAAKIFSDAWVTMKTIDEGLAPPTGFTNANLDQILTSIKTNNNL